MLILPVRSRSRMRRPVIRKPETTKKRSTPMKPPVICVADLESRPTWKSSTRETAMPRSPSMSGRKPSFSPALADLGRATPDSAFSDRCIPRPSGALTRVRRNQPASRDEPSGVRPAPLPGAAAHRLPDKEMSHSRTDRLGGPALRGDRSLTLKPLFFRSRQEARDNGLGHAPGPGRVARQANAGLVAAKTNDVAAHRSESSHRRCPRQRTQPDDEFALLARDRGNAGVFGSHAQLDHLEQPKDRCRQRPEPVGQLLAERGQLAGVPDTPKTPVQLEFLGGLGDVGIRQVGIDRQVDHGAGTFDQGRSFFEFGLLLLHRLRQQSGVEVETHGGDMAMLLSPEDVSCAAYLQVGERNLETGAQLRGVEDGLEALPGYVGELLSTAVQKVRVGAATGPADSAAKLVELGQAECVGAIDDDRVGVRNIEA